MKIGSGIYQGQQALVVVTDQGVFRGASLMRTPATMSELLAEAKGVERLGQALEQAVKEGRAPDGEPDQWLAPVPSPSKVICVGLNYRPHVAESGLELPTSPVLFPKFPNAIVGTGATVHPPEDTKQMDYEAELVLIMGKTCHQVSEQKALNYVLGYANGNDLSARDLQFRTSQWLLGKAGDGMGPVGPYLVTKDEIPDPNHLSIVGRRNGAVVQSANTEEMIFSCAEIIAYISQYLTLEPGDVIFTGTPEGVILGQPEDKRRWLQAGETVSVAIEGLGELVTTIGSVRS